MCDQTDYDRIVQALTELINKESVFTTFDVTNALRALGDFNESHRTVRNVIHERFNSDASEFVLYNRTRTPLDIGGREIEVLVFHPTGSPSTDHPLAKKVNSFAGTASPFTGKVSGSGSGVTASITKDHRLQIPKSILDAVGQDTVTVQVGNQTTQYVRNNDGRVRVTFINPTKTDYRVSLDPQTNAIVIE